MQKKTFVIAGVGALVAALVLWGFVEGRQELAQERERERPVAVPPRVAAATNGAEVVFDAQALKLADIGIANLVQTAHREEIEALATVLPAQELTDLRNRYVAAMAQADKAAAALAASRNEYDRVKVLHADAQNVSDRTFQSAEAAWRADAAAAQAARAAVAAIGEGGRQSWGRALAAAAEGNTPLFRQLADRSRVLIRIAVPANTGLRKPPATASVIGNDGVVHRAALVSPAPQADPRIQGPTFFYAAPADGLLPGSTLTARLPAGAAESGVIVPAAAVLSWQGKSWFYVERAPGHFLRQELTGAVPVAAGWFAPGLPTLRVVERGAQTLLSEELRGQIKGGEEDD